jgi:N,N'-diacetyllegionaminate synthase
MVVGRYGSSINHASASISSWRGEGYNVKIVAEIGMNHCGSRSRAEGLLRDLVQTRVDAITYQIREKPFYDESHPRKFEFDDDFYQEAIRCGQSHGKEVGFAIAQPEKVEALDALGCDLWKTLSWDLANASLHTLLQATGKKVYASTGVSGMDEIAETSQRFTEIDLIHTQLTEALEDVNLKAISSIQAATGRGVGFGLHCAELQVLYAAVAMEPSAIFFYVKDLTDGEHPDDGYAVPIDQVDAFAYQLKRLSSAVGDGEKSSQQSTTLPADDPLHGSVGASVEAMR